VGGALQGEIQTGGRRKPSRRIQKIESRPPIRELFPKIRRPEIPKKKTSTFCSEGKEEGSDVNSCDRKEGCEKADGQQQTVVV